VIGGKDKNGNKQQVTRKDNFTITSASEIMAICCLSKNMEDLKNRLGNIMVAISKSGKPVYARDLKAEGSMAVLLRNTLCPNLVQTIEGTPAFVHLGPFANIAHGCNSINATKLALATSDYVITEAGFGSDLGAEKFLDLKCRVADLSPNAVVLVCTIRGMKFHGQTDGSENKTELELLEKGLENVYHHIDTLKNTFGASVVVTINKFLSDTDEEIELVTRKLKEHGTRAVVNECFAKGGAGTIELANAVLDNLSDKKTLFAYNLDDTIQKKIEDIVKNVYGGKDVEYSELATQKIAFIEKTGYSNLPIIIAKTQFSLSDDKEKLGAPQNFTVHVRDVELKTGAGFIVVIAGDMMLMPGLSKVPNAEKIDISSDGTITGLS
jgi:formate--tetrahydrofolate ligase